VIKEGLGEDGGGLGAGGGGRQEADGWVKHGAL